MADAFSTNLNFTLPEVSGSTDTWGTKINANFSALDLLFPSGELQVASGGTGASTAPLARANLGAAGVGVTNTFTAQQLMALALSAGAVVPLGLRNSDPSPAAGSAVIFDLDPANNGAGVRSAQLEAVTNGANQIDLYLRTSNGDLPVRVLKVGYNGDVLAEKKGGVIGYDIGTGGAVVQEDFRTATVTVNALTGQITLCSAAGSTSWTSFTVGNSYVKQGDVIIVNQRSGTDRYEVHVTDVVNGSFELTFRTTGGTTTENPVLAFAVLRGQAA